MAPNDKRSKALMEQRMLRTNSSIFENRNFVIKQPNQDCIIKQNDNRNIRISKNFLLFNPKNHSLINNKEIHFYRKQLRNSRSVNELTYSNKKTTIHNNNNFPIIKSSIPSTNNSNSLLLNINNNHHFKNLRKVNIAKVFRTSDKYSLQKDNNSKMFVSKGNSIFNSPDKKIKSLSKIHLSDSKKNKISISSKSKDQFIRSAANFHNDKNIFTARKQKNNLKIVQDVNIESDNDDIYNLNKGNEMIRSYAYSQSGKDSRGEDKVNQDSFLIIDNVLDLEGFSIFGVFDGHGSNGHLVSQFIQKKASDYFCNINVYTCPKKGPLNYATITYDQIIDRLLMNNYSVIKKFYKQVNNDLNKENIDVNFSGSTCTLIIKVFKKLFISNTGDSRAIMINENKFKIDHKLSTDPCYRYEVIQLTTDHKPDLMKEQKRIEKAGGVISQYEEGGVKNGPMRVWVKGEDYPGIAMSRSIGDKVAKTVGVSHEPDVVMKEILGTSKYIVLCSDGVWEFMTNETVMDIVNPLFLLGDPEEACKELVRKASEKWEKEDSRDDITVVIDFLGYQHLKKGTA